MEKISTDAFIDCKNLSKVNLNKKLKIIPEFIFWGCDNLELVNIPKTIKKIEKQAFYSDKNLIINYEGTKQDWMNIDLVYPWITNHIYISYVHCLADNETLEY